MLTVQILVHVILAQEQDGVSTICPSGCLLFHFPIYNMHAKLFKVVLWGKISSNSQITKGNYFWTCSRGFEYLLTNTLKAKQTLDLLRTLIRSGRLQLTENHRAHCPPPPSVKQTHLMVLAVMLCAISLEASSSSTALVAQPTTGGGRELEKRYGRERCLSRSMRGLGPTVYPPEKNMSTEKGSVCFY